jgi:hypothetical protein
MFKEQVCAEFKIISTAPLKIEPVTNLPLEYCDKIYGFRAEDQLKINAWVDDTQDWAKTHCK